MPTNYNENTGICSLLCLLLCLLLCGCEEQGESSIPLRISLDTNPDHLRNITIRRFVDAVNAEPSLGINATLFESGQLAKDRDIPKALHWGSLDMGVPAQSKLSRFVPEANVFTLPALYGLPRERFFALLYGPVGQAIDKAVEQRLAVKVLGRSIPLGFATTYTSEKALRTVADMSGMKIRVPGGSGPVFTMSYLEASPVTLPIADVPLALAQGAINGIQSTHETVASTALWEVGIRYCYEDRAYLLLYTPVVSRTFWSRLTAQQKDGLAQVWDKATLGVEEYAKQRQLAAKKKLALRGVECINGDLSELQTVRDAMAGASETLAAELEIALPVLEALKYALSEAD